MGISTQSVNLNVENYGYSANYSVTTSTANQNTVNNIFISTGYEQEAAYAPADNYNEAQAPVVNNYFISVGEQPQQNIVQLQNPNIFIVSNNPITNILNAIKAANEAQQYQDNVNSLKGIADYLKTLIEYKKTMDELAAVRKALANIKKNKDWSMKTDAQREKDSVKLCNKLDKLGFNQELIDKLQLVLEKGNIEDLPKSKLKKFNKIMNKIADVAKNNVRLTRAQLEKYSAMIEKAVDMVEVDDEKLAA